MKKTISISGNLIDFGIPKVMGILNVTPDSFYAESRCRGSSDIEDRVKKMMEEGADIIDIGAYSSRPGADNISISEELNRLLPALDIVRKVAPDALISVDTFRAEVAMKAIDSYKANIINDIGGGTMDPEIWDCIAEKQCAYVMMHTRGTPSTMSQLTDYNDVTEDVISDLSFKLAALRQKGVADVIVDPGFGFAKTVEQNFNMLARLKAFQQLDTPILVGISRKSMITKTLNITADAALNATTALNMTALLNGADLLRVHDVGAASQCVALFKMIATQTNT